jgi:hypothetical protein
MIEWGSVATAESVKEWKTMLCGPKNFVCTLDEVFAQ